MGKHEACGGPRALGPDGEPPLKGSKGSGLHFLPHPFLLPQTLRNTTIVSLIFRSCHLGPRDDFWS